MSDDTPPETPEAMRHRATSSADWVEAATGSHSLTSSPPGVRRVYELVGYWMFWTVREGWTHKKIVIHWMTVSAGLVALSHHLWHWIK